MFERFTDRARKVVDFAKQEATKLNHEYLGTEHLLLGLIKESSGVAANVLTRLGCSVHKVGVEVERLVQEGPDILVTGDTKFSLTPALKKVYECAIEESGKLNHNYVGTEHLLLGLLRCEGTASDILTNLGLNLQRVRDEVLDLLGFEPTAETSIIDFIERYAPAGLHQTRVNLEDQIKTGGLTLSYSNPSIIISVDLKNSMVSIGIPSFANLDKVESQLAFAHLLRNELNG